MGDSTENLSIRVGSRVIILRSQIHSDFGWKRYTLPCSSLTGSVNDAGCSARCVSHFWSESSCYVLL